MKTISHVNHVSADNVNHRALAYTGAVHEIPLMDRRKVDRALLGFLVPFLSNTKNTDADVCSKLRTFAAPEFLGGYKVDFITLHLDLLRLKTVMKYLKCLVYNLELPSCLYFMEYNLGLQLCSLFNLHCNSRTPHAFSPNQHHSSVLQLIRHHRISQGGSVRRFTVIQVVRGVVRKKKNKMTHPPSELPV